MNNPFLPSTASAPLPSSFPLPPSPQPSVLVVELPKEAPSNELPPSPPASEPSSLEGSTPLPSSTINPMTPNLDTPPSPSKMPLPTSPPESPTLLEQDRIESDPSTSTSISPPPPPSSTDETVASPTQLTPTAIESTPFGAPVQLRETPAVASTPVLAQNSQSVQLPSDATDSLLLSSTSKPTLHKKKSFLGIGIKRDRSVSAPATESSSKPAVKEAVVKKKSSLMGGLLRSLTGKSGTKKAKTSGEQPGLLTRGLFVIEDRSEKARVEKEELKQEELANEQKIKNHVATLLLPASSRPPSGSAPSPTRPARASSASPARKEEVATESSDVGLDHPGINASETSQTVSGGPNHRLSSSSSPQQAPPPRQFYQQQPQFKATSPPSNKPKLNVSVPTYTPPSGTSPRAVASNPIPIQQTFNKSKPTTYARNSSGSSSGSESDSDDDDVCLTIKKKTPVEQQVERNEEEEAEADEDGKLSSLGHGNSPVTPGLPATPPDPAISQEQGAAGFGSFFGSVRGRKSGGGRPPTMLFGKASTSPQFNQQHYSNQQQQHHYQSYNQKQENRQSRIPVSPVMHTAADVAAKIQAAEGEDQKNAEAFFM